MNGVLDKLPFSTRPRRYHPSSSTITGPERELFFETSFGPALVYSSAAQLPMDLRLRAFAGQPKDFGYYQIAAETLADQFQHRYLVLQNQRTGQSALQPIFLADQDILEGLPHQISSTLTTPRKIFPRWLKLRMLVAGGSACDGSLDCQEPWAVTALHEALEKYARHARAAMILLKDFPAKFRPGLAPFANNGYRRVPSMPGCRLPLDFANFERYMSERLGRKLRYKYIKLNKQPRIPFEVHIDVTPMAAELHALYLQTHERSAMRFEKLPPEFFARIGRELPDRARFFIWRVDGKIAAFALCLVHDGAMHHLNIGFDYSVSLDLQLYYVTIRDLFQWALDQGLKHYETGQLNYDPKLHLRMTLAPLDLYARHTSPLLNPIFKRALEYLQPVRHDPTLREFPNYHEL